MQNLIDDIFSLRLGDEAAFEAVWAKVFAYQVNHCAPYDRYCNELKGVHRPYFPIEAFKHRPVISFEKAADAAVVFKSSGTGRGVSAQHFVTDAGVYERSAETHFTQRFGSAPVTLAAYLPHYAAMGEQSSSLYMMKHLIETSGDGHSGFFLGREDELRGIVEAASPSRPLILFGAAFGLLDLLEKYTIHLPAHAYIIETGGMKTYRKEISREELHNRLAEGFRIPPVQVLSEYGMCELLSQCYSRGGHTFYPPPWMRFEIMDPENPLEPQQPGKPGALAVIDLANIYSVSAILTQDKAVEAGEGFEVLGRLQGAELRGCNFLFKQV